MGGDDESTSRTHRHDGTDDEGVESLGRQMSESSIYATEEEEEDDDSKLHLGPQYTIKEHLEKDKVASFFSFYFFNSKLYLLNFFLKNSSSDESECIG